MNEYAARIDRLNKKLTEAQSDRDTALNDGDAERVHEMDLDIERITADLKRFEMLAEKAEY